MKLRSLIVLSATSAAVLASAAQSANALPEPPQGPGVRPAPMSRPAPAPSRRPTPPAPAPVAPAPIVRYSPPVHTTPPVAGPIRTNPAPFQPPVRTAPPVAGPIRTNPAPFQPPVRTAPPVAGPIRTNPAPFQPPVRTAPPVAGPIHSGPAPVPVHAGPISIHAGNGFRPPVEGQPRRVDAPRVVDAHSSFGMHGMPTAEHPTHVSTMVVGRVAPGVVVVRGEHMQMHYGENGAATVYHLGFNGQRVVHYEQQPYGQGFRREYHLGAEVVYRNYSPVVWGGSSYRFYAYTPNRYEEWRVGGYYGFGEERVYFNNGYYDWCHHEGFWHEGYEGYHYGWASEGWYARPWFGYYRYYFPMYGEYRSPAHWMTDWYFGELLANYYSIREAEAIAAYDNAYALDFETKELMRAQINQAMFDHQNGLMIPVSNYLNTEHLYVVSEYTPVLTVDGYNCAISHGDVIEQSGYAYEGQETLSMRVVRSKRGSCYPNQIISLDVSQLQEYQNDFSARIETGMGHMRTRFYRF